MIKIYNWDETTDGSLSETALINKLESLGYKCSLYIYPPGTVFPEHEHSVDKIDAVLSGQFKISMLGEELVLHRGEYIHVPKGCIHRAEVIGNDNVASIDAIKAN